MTGATDAPSTKRRLFPLCGVQVAVVQYEGTVQIGFYDDACDCAPHKLLSNLFVDTDTPWQLLALVRHLGTLPLPEAVPVGADGGPA